MYKKSTRNEFKRISNTHTAPKSALRTLCLTHLCWKRDIIKSNTNKKYTKAKTTPDRFFFLLFLLSKRKRNSHENPKSFTAAGSFWYQYQRILCGSQPFAKKENITHTQHWPGFSQIKSKRPTHIFYRNLRTLGTCREEAVNWIEIRWHLARHVCASLPLSVCLSVRPSRCLLSYKDPSLLLSILRSSQLRFSSAAIIIPTH